MKRLICVCTCLCVLISATLVAYAKCDSFSLDDVSTSLPSTKMQSSQWLREVNYSLNLATRVSSDEQVVLKDYKYLGVVDSNEAKQKLIDDVFHKEAITIRYGLDLGAIEFYTWKELREFNIEGNNELIAKVSDLITVGVTEALELTWLYQGVIYKSKAIVDSEDGIIFDNIASYALDYSAKIPRQEDHKYGRLSSTRSLYAMGLLDSMDSVGGDSVHTFVFELSDMADRIELTTGKPAWKYSIKVRSIFDDNGILIYRRCESKSEAALGWACEAAAETISGNLYSSPYHEFAWGWSYGSNNTTINISFAGNGFTITGGDHTERGTEIHSPIYYQ